MNVSAVFVKDNNTIEIQPERIAATNLDVSLALSFLMLPDIQLQMTMMQ